MDFLAVENYLKNFKNLPEDMGLDYDALSAVYLLKAILENIQENFQDYDFEDRTYVLDEKDEMLLKRLVEEIQKVENSKWKRKRSGQKWKIQILKRLENL